MKGITPIIAIILLLVIVITVVGFSFTIFQDVVETSGEAATSAVERETTKASGCMRIESVADETIYIRNCGLGELTDFKVYVDDISVDITGDPIPEGTVNPIYVDLSAFESGEHTFRVTTSSYAKDTLKMYVDISGGIPSPPPATAPIISLDQPGDGTSPPSEDVYFQCTATADGENTIDFIELWTTVGGWHLEFIYDAPNTNQVEILEHTVLGISDGLWEWNCKGIDNDAITEDGWYPSNYVFTVSGGSGDSSPPSITGDFVTEGYEGEPLIIAVNTTDENNFVVDLYYRIPGQPSYTVENMVFSSGDEFRVTIPGGSITYVGLEYYINATDEFYNSALGAGTPTSPQYVTVYATKTLTNNDVTDEIIADGTARKVESFGEFTFSHGNYNILYISRYAISGGYDYRRSYIDFNTDTIPLDAKIDNVYLILNKGEGSLYGENEIDIRHLTTMGSTLTSTPEELEMLFNLTGNGTLYVSEIPFPDSIEYYYIDLGLTATQDLENQLDTAWFSIGFNCDETYTGGARPGSEDNTNISMRPALNVTYHKGP
ncbi:hypothetical protein ACFLQN_01075 [Candidatus Aenigmatarchaeota archaeon]